MDGSYSEIAFDDFVGVNPEFCVNSLRNLQDDI